MTEKFKPQLTEEQLKKRKQIVKARGRFLINPKTALGPKENAETRGEFQFKTEFTPVVAVTNQAGTRMFVERKELDDPRVTSNIVESLLPSERFALALLYGSEIKARVSERDILGIMRTSGVKRLELLQIGKVVETMNDTLDYYRLKIEPFLEMEGGNSYYLTQKLSSNTANGLRTG